MHLSDGDLQRLLDGALAPPREGPVRRHVLECPRCRTRLSQARAVRETIEGALTLLDPEPPDVTVADIHRRARRVGRHLGILRAASIVLALVVVGGVAHASATLSLRSIFQHLLPSPSGDVRDARPGSLPPPGNGVAVRPSVRFEIRIQADAPRVVAAVRLTTSTDEVTVRSSSSSTLYRSDRARLSVEVKDAGTQLSIDVPTTATAVAILVSGRTVWTYSRGRISTDVGATDAGTYDFSVPHADPAGRHEPRGAWPQRR